MEACNPCVVGVGAVRFRDDAEGRNRCSVLRPHDVLGKLVTISVGSRDLDINAVPSGWVGDGGIGSHRHGNTVKHGDGDAVGDVEASSTDAVGLNGPLPNPCRLPTHVVEQQIGGDVRDFTGGLVHLDPRQRARINSVVVRIVEVGMEVHGVVSGHLKHSAGCRIGVVRSSTDAHRVEEPVVNGHVDGNLVNGRAVVVGRRHHVGVIAGEIRRKRRRITIQILKEV